MCSSEDLQRLKACRPPENPELLEELSVGVNFLTDFWLEKYLDEYISLGGSKIKFIAGNEGSGKSHFLMLFSNRAAARGYKTVLLSAKTTWMHDFKEIYAAVLGKADLTSCLERCADTVAREMGFNPGDVPEGVTFAEYLAAGGCFDPITKRELRRQLVELFLKNPRIDKNFAICAGLLTGGILGYPILEQSSRELLMSWLRGERGVSLPALRKLGLSPSRISKYNARHMLRSLVEVLKMAGYAGLIVGVDDLDVIADPLNTNEIRYTKMRREDAYESIRELIDEIDTLSNVMFVFAFDRLLMDSEKAGLKSYQALWMRIQNEIESSRFNRFTDVVDVDKLARQEYNTDTLLEMSRRLAGVFGRQGGNAAPLNFEAASSIIAGSGGGLVSLPSKVNRMTLERLEWGEGGGDYV